MVNNATADLDTNRTLTANGAGLDNNISLNMSGGKLSGDGPLVNGGAITSTGYITFTGSGGLINNGQITLTGDTFTLDNSGANIDNGTIKLAFQGHMAMNSGLSNDGVLNLSGMGDYYRHPERARVR